MPEGSQPRTEKETEAELGMRLALSCAFVRRGVRRADAEGGKKAGREGWAWEWDWDWKWEWEGGVGVRGLDGSGDGAESFAGPSPNASVGPSPVSSGMVADAAAAAAERDDFLDFFFFFFRFVGSVDRVFVPVLLP